MAVSIKSFVVDASFVLSSLLPDEESPSADKYIRRHINGDIELISSRIFEFEVFNGFRSAILKKRITKEDTLRLSEKFLKLGIKYEDADIHEAFLVALKENLSVYDASYVYLARLKRISLLTLDSRLKRLAI